MPPYLQRKYIDLIRQVSSKWVNWDPPIGIQVGAYGTIDKETGDWIVEGNVYDPAFQTELDKHNAGIVMADFPPQEGPVEGDFVIASRGAKARNLNVDTEVCVILAVLRHDMAWPNGVHSRSQGCSRDRQCIRQRTVAFRAWQASCRPYHAQPASNLHPP
jgi:hypothetical protein